MYISRVINVTRALIFLTSTLLNNRAFINLKKEILQLQFTSTKRSLNHPVDKSGSSLGGGGGGRRNESREIG